jgi:hypothetical protein
MPTDNHADPAAFKGVMVSSTFTDLIQHRNALIKAIDAHDLKAVVMENDSAKPMGDVLDSSLAMVRKAAAYVGVISHKYGQIPEDAARNPEGLSLTELEFGEAVRLRRPLLLFIMGAEHQVRPADVEVDPEKKRKLDAFRERAKRLTATSFVDRVTRSSTTCTSSNWPRCSPSDTCATISGKSNRPRRKLHRLLSETTSRGRLGSTPSRRMSGRTSSSGATRNCRPSATGRQPPIHIPFSCSKRSAVRVRACSRGNGRRVMQPTFARTGRAGSGTRSTRRAQSWRTSAGARSRT